MVVCVVVVVVVVVVLMEGRREFRGVGGDGGSYIWLS